MDTKNQIEILQAEAAIKKLVEEMTRYSTHSREAEAAVKSIKDAIKELMANRESLNSFSQDIRNTLRESTTNSIAEIKGAVDHLEKCIEQENTENQRFYQSNDQLQTLVQQLAGVVQSVNQTIEGVRQVLDERLQGLDQTLEPFKEVVVKQEVALSQLGGGFEKLTTYLYNLKQEMYSATAQGAEDMLSALKPGIATIEQRFDSTQEMLDTTVKSIEKTSGDITVMLSRIEQILLDRLSSPQQDSAVAMEHLSNAQSKAMKILKWNMALIFFNLAALASSFAYFFFMTPK